MPTSSILASTLLGLINLGSSVAIDFNNIPGLGDMGTLPPPDPTASPSFFESLDFNDIPGLGNMGTLPPPDPTASPSFFESLDFNDIPGLGNMGTLPPPDPTESPSFFESLDESFNNIPGLNLGFLPTTVPTATTSSPMVTETLDLNQFVEFLGSTSPTVTSTTMEPNDGPASSQIVEKKDDVDLRPLLTSILIVATLLLITLWAMFFFWVKSKSLSSVKEHIRDSENETNQCDAGTHDSTMGDREHCPHVPRRTGGAGGGLAAR